METLILVLALISLALFVLYIIKVKAFNSLYKETSDLSSDKEQLEKEILTLETELKFIRQTIDDNEITFDKLNEKFQSSFKGLAAEALDLNNKQFLELAKQNLENESLKNQGHIEKKYQAFEELVNPLKLTLNSYQEKVQNLEVERGKTFTKVEAELQKINDINLKLSKETSALKNALKKPHIRGRWGEVQLKNCIDLAGMSEFADVSFQNSTTTSDGNRYVPDMSVRMPGDKYIYVDAKTPIDAFLESLEANNDAERESQMLRHGQHVKNHIKQLSTKAYSEKLKNSADFTIMFLPNESFLYAALETQGDIIEFALERKILIATPPTLIGLLKVIRYGWNEQQLSENAKIISQVGTELHKRICDFVDAYANVGKFLDKAQTEYHAGMTRLESRVLTQARRLERLGAKSHKSLPDGLGQELEMIEEVSPDA